MTEDEFRNGPAKMLPLESFSDKPNQPSRANPLGLSDRYLEEDRRLNAAMANRAAIDGSYKVEATAADGRVASVSTLLRSHEDNREALNRQTVRGPMICVPGHDGDHPEWLHVDTIGSVRGHDDGGAVIGDRAGLNHGEEWVTSLTVDEVLERIERAAVMK